MKKARFWRAVEVLCLPTESAALRLQRRCRELQHITCNAARRCLLLRSTIDAGVAAAVGARGSVALSGNPAALRGGRPRRRLLLLLRRPADRVV